MIVAYNEVDVGYIFRIDYPAEKLQDYDQEHGWEYIFSVKAYNRAGLSITMSTTPYQIHSKVLPTNGKIFHVPQSNIAEEFINEIGFQENDDVVCVKWKDFYHHNNELTFTIGLATAKGINDVVPSTAVNNTGSYCFTGLALPHLRQYFVNINVYNIQGGVNVTSHGIFIGAISEVHEHSRVDDGLDCILPFQVLETDFHLQQSQQKDLVVSQGLSSQMHYTIAVSHEWNDDLDTFEVSTPHDKVTKYSWHFLQNSATQYFKIPAMENNQTIIILAKSDVYFHSISVSPCVKDQTIQASTQALQSAWTFRPEVLSAVTHYKVFVNEFYCSPAPCQDGGEIYPETVVGVDSFIGNLQLHPSDSYRTSVQPCFGPSCTDAVASGGIVVDPYPAISSQIACVISPQHSITQDTTYSITVSWDAFTQAKGLRDPFISVYDWSLAASPTGGAILMPWNRVQMQQGASTVNVRILVYSMYIPYIMSIPILIAHLVGTYDCSCFRCSPTVHFQCMIEGQCICL